MRRSIFSASILGATAFPPQNLTKCPGNGTAGAVLRGVDLVDLLEHYEQGGSKRIPEKGVATFAKTLPDETYSLNYVFHFKTQENADKFAANATRYLPGGGGY